MNKFKSLIENGKRILGFLVLILIDNKEKGKISIKNNKSILGIINRWVVDYRRMMREVCHWSVWTCWCWGILRLVRPRYYLVWGVSSVKRKTLSKLTLSFSTGHWNWWPLRLVERRKKRGKTTILVATLWWSSLMQATNNHKRKSDKKYSKSMVISNPMLKYLLCWIKLIFSTCRRSLMIPKPPRLITNLHLQRWIYKLLSKNLNYRRFRTSFRSLIALLKLVRGSRNLEKSFTSSLLWQNWNTKSENKIIKLTNRFLIFFLNIVWFFLFAVDLFVCISNLQ